MTVKRVLAVLAIGVGVLVAIPAILIGGYLLVQNFGLSTVWRESPRVPDGAQLLFQSDWFRYPDAADRIQGAARASHLECNVPPSAVAIRVHKGESFKLDCLVTQDGRYATRITFDVFGCPYPQLDPMFAKAHRWGLIWQEVRGLHHTYPVKIPSKPNTDWCGRPVNAPILAGP